MHTFWSRLSALFAFSTTTLAVLTVLLVLSTSYKSYEELAKIEIGNVSTMVKKLTDHNYMNGRENDLGLLRFDLKADFEDCFDWNVKQLFIYMTADYETPDNKFNQIVLWDHIINRGDFAKVNLKYAPPKYYMWDDGLGLKGNQNVTLSISMNIIPNAGLLRTAKSPYTHTFAFPDSYTK